MKIFSSLKKYCQELAKRRFIKDVLLVGFGIASAQAITLFFMPALTRMYGPEAFGVVGVYTSIATVISPIVTFGYTNAIILPKEDAEAFSLIKLSLGICLLMTVILFSTIYIFNYFFLKFIGFESSSNILFLLPISLLFISISSCLNQLAIRFGAFKIKSRSHVESTLFTNVTKLGVGVIAPNGISLIIINLFTIAINTLILRSRLKINIKNLRILNFDVKAVAHVAKFYRESAFYRMPQSVLNAGTVNLPILVLSSLFGTSSAGQYSLAFLVLGAPVMLLSESVGQVFSKKISYAINNQQTKIEPMIFKATKGLFLASVAPFALVTVAGDNIFTAVFGAELLRAGQYSQWLAPFLLSLLLNRPSIAAIPALGLEKYFLYYEIIITLLRGGAIALGFQVFKSDLFAVALFSIVSIIGNWFLIIIVLMYAKKLDEINASNFRCSNFGKLV